MSPVYKLMQLLMYGQQGISKDAIEVPQKIFYTYVENEIR